MRLQGRRILVVGVGHGLGSATAYFLLKEGARVVISARTEEKLKEIKEMLSKYGEISYVVGDPSTLQGAEKLIAESVKRLGGIDDLVALVGTYANAPIGSITEEHMALLIDANLKAPIYAINASLPHLKDGASIVMVSSTKGLSYRATAEVGYASTKAGVAKATEALANELIPKHIRVNAVAPMAMKPDFVPGRDWEKDRKLGDRECPPEDVASVILFLLTKESEWINGTVIPVDGGSRLGK